MKKQIIEESIRDSLYSWVSPKGEVVPVSIMGHEEGAKRILKKLKIPRDMSDNIYIQMFKMGWYRVTFFAKIMFVNNEFKKYTSKQLKEFKNIAIENGAKYIEWDDGEGYNVIWSRDQMNESKIDKFRKVINEHKSFIKEREEIGNYETSLFKYIGSMEIPEGTKSYEKYGPSIKMYNATKDHGDLIENSTYAEPNLIEKGYLRTKSGKGVSDDIRVEDLAIKHGVSLNQIIQKLIKGMQIEAQSGVGNNLSKKVAMDRLFIDPNFYN